MFVIPLPCLLLAFLLPLAFDVVTLDDDGQTLILNANHPLVKTVMEEPESDRSKLISEQLYDLAVLANKQLPPEEMKKFIERSNDIMMKL